MLCFWFSFQIRTAQRVCHFNNNHSQDIQMIGIFIDITYSIYKHICAWESSVALKRGEGVLNLELYAEVSLENGSTGCIECFQLMNKWQKINLCFKNAVPVNVLLIIEYLCLWGNHRLWPFKVLQIVFVTYTFLTVNTKNVMPAMSQAHWQINKYIYNWWLTENSRSGIKDSDCSFFESAAGFNNWKLTDQFYDVVLYFADQLSQKFATLII